MFDCEDIDVAVIGGGSAGICAAVAAAREGARVVLLEQSGRLGGMGTLAQVHTFCGLYHPDVSRPPVVVNAGLPEEIEAQMRERTGQSTPVKMGRVYVLPQQPEVFDTIAKEMVEAESSQLRLMLETRCLKISRLESGQFLVGFENSDAEPGEFQCRSVVDCSADAVVAEFLGATRVMDDVVSLLRPAFIFSFQHVDTNEVDDEFRMRLALALAHAVRDDELPETALGVTLRMSPKQGEVFVSVDLDSMKNIWTPTSSKARGEIEVLGRELAVQLGLFLKSKYPCFERVSTPQFSQKIGVRESFRWLGEYTLTSEDLISGKKFDDAVAWAAWPIELRETTRGARFEYFEQTEPSGIPLRALTSREVPGVFFAGRCISATHRALASVRVMGTCFATGQAAGKAASEYARV